MDIDYSAVMMSLQTYYGMDWMSFVFGLLGMWMLTKKNMFGFFFLALSILLAGVVAFIANQYGFIVANTLQFVIAMKGLLEWRIERRKGKFVIEAESGG